MAKRLDLPLVQLGVDFKIRSVVNGAAVSPDDQRETTQSRPKPWRQWTKRSIAQSTVSEFLDDLPVSEPQRALLRGPVARFLWRRSTRHRPAHGGRIQPWRKQRLLPGSDRQSIIGESGMAAQLPDVRLGHVVSAVTHHQGGASIKGEAANGAFDVEADAVILAIPVKRLTELEFNPGSCPRLSPKPFRLSPWE